MFQQFFHSILDFIYPKHCLHCGLKILPSSSLLCEGCSTLLTFLNPERRCPTCFFISNSQGHTCRRCRDDSSFYYRKAAAFEYAGPAASLIKKLKYENEPYLVKYAGAFLAMQWERLAWPVPDAIVPVPLPFNRKIVRGYNQTELLAKELGKILQVPVWNILGRKSGEFSQAALNLEQRKLVKKESFFLKKGYSLTDKTLLVIDDVMTTGSTLKKCSEVLIEGCPSQLFALTVCITEN